MVCNKCKKKVENDKNFCPNCGNSLKSQKQIRLIIKILLAIFIAYLLFLIIFYFGYYYKVRH